MTTIVKRPGGREGWQLDEAGAVAYERMLVPAFMDPWAKDLVETVGVGPGDEVLDVACGTGIVARHAARVPAAAVTGTDVNPAMVAVARDVAAAAGQARIRYEVAGADSLPFAAGAFTVVLCQQGLQFFPEPGAALAEMRRVARPGARLGLSTCRGLEHQPGYAVMVDVLTRRVGVEAGDIIASPYRLGETRTLTSYVERAGFSAVHARIVVSTFRIPSAEAFLQAETSSSPLGDLLASLDADVARGVVDELAEALRPHSDDEGVIFPFETLVVTAVG